MSFKDEMLCSKTHEYVVNNAGEYVIGLTDYAIDQLGDIVFLELPDVGAEFGKGETFANIEPVKAASEIYMPVGGKVTVVNDSLVDSPEKLNEDCYENGWLIKITPSAYDDDKSDLLNYDDYKKEVE